MNKVWLISGTSTGLGRLMTERLLERGDRVIATLRRTEALRSLQTRYGDQLHVLPMELTDTAEVRSTVAQAFAWAGKVDVGVSNEYAEGSDCITISTRKGALVVVETVPDTPILTGNKA